MIEKIHIQNFKSIYDLELKVGRVNLFIGENGSGKSNLLEALVFVSASESNKLDNEFLVSRGLRVPEPEFMRSAFSKNNEDIKIVLATTKQKLEYQFSNKNIDYSPWEVDFNSVYNENNIDFDLLDKQLEEEMNIIDEYTNLSDTLIDLDTQLNEKIEIYKKNPKNPKLKEDLKKIIISKMKLELVMENLDKKLSNLHNFLIYSPENTSLRIFQREGQIQPLGINGEGLLKLLKVINNYTDKSYIETIIKSLQLFNWFEDIKLPNDDTLESKVIIKDRYLYSEFDQRSANEGFLFILFYITLIVAKETPKAFAIDNIDASLNPKLCTKLMTIITDLAKKYDKQIFLTTHNPAILDGINLNDKEQKLFVVSRNKKGHTRMKEIRVEDKPKSSDKEPLKLSESFLRGYLGGLPKGF